MTGVDTVNRKPREVDEYIVERYGNYAEFDPTNTTVLDWVEATRKRLVENQYDS